MSTTPARRALVIGGGIGGLAAAIALQRIGWQVAVYERAPELREVGAGLSLWANAVRALDKLGIAAPIRALRPPAPSGGIYTWRGDPLISQSISELERRVGEISVVVHRAELLAVLQQALNADTTHLDATCVGIRQDELGVVAQFADGTTARGDLLIGADGLRSVVRAQLFGAAAPRYAGYTSWRGIATSDTAQLPFGEYWGRGARFGIAPLSGGRVYWFATHNVSPGQHGTPQEERALLDDIFGSWCAPIPALLAATPDAAILRHDIADRDPLAHWSVGRVTLLGDAAHPMTPNLGQGACQALEDAVALGESLRAHDDIVLALGAYEQRRVARANAIVRQSRRIGQIGQWSNPLACRLREALLRSVAATLQARSVDQVIGYAV
jgi:2-polyprenyl-6-methoxyphenol hydroxylase-like FAD-dependent oxidoreductase